MSSGRSCVSAVSLVISQQDAVRRGGLGGVRRDRSTTSPCHSWDAGAEALAGALPRTPKLLQRGTHWAQAHAEGGRESPCTRFALVWGRQTCPGTRA